MEFQGIRSRVYIRFLETLDFGARIFNEFQRFWRTEWQSSQGSFSLLPQPFGCKWCIKRKSPSSRSCILFWDIDMIDMHIREYPNTATIYKPGCVICLPLASSFSIMWGKKWNELVCNFYEVQAQSCQIVFPWQRLQGLGLQDCGVKVVMKCACSAMNFAPSYPISTRVADSLGCLVPWTIQNVWLQDFWNPLRLEILNHFTP